MLIIYIYIKKGNDNIIWLNKTNLKKYIKII